MTESSPDGSSSERKNFICGVVEGFYGRPWTTEQRKDLFQKLKKWSLDMYVYAPKDDYKHRAYWRELYTVEEAEHLTSLISAAKAQGITFCYALSPGLDITYSSQKEISILKRKLEQVSQFGCTCFALLFDDIEPEMSEADKQTFQSFAHAQVSVTNEIHQHLGCPKFLLCPTQYCATRAVPTVISSEYLNTLGTKLSQEIDIMWTGPKVISKTLTTECIEEITQVLRRPPVIWDNLHANDYDQKRIFLGPYCGRSAELIPLLRGVLTNPNCEYNANMIAIYTLAHWAKCSLDAPPHMESVSWDIKLEREGEQGVYEDEVPLSLGKHVYHHRQALREAINEWLPEFSIPKTAQGPVIKPQPPPMPPVPIIPIIPSVNTCMSLVTVTATTSTSSARAIPTVHTSALQALADTCSEPDRPISSTGITLESFNPVPNPVMNSLVSPTKVVLNESIPNPIIPMANIVVPAEIPVSSITAPVLGLKNIDDQNMEKGDDTLLADSLLEGESFLEEKKLKDEDIVVDDCDNQQNGEMSIGDTPQTLSPLRASGTELELDVDSASANATDDVAMNDVISENGSMQVEPSHSPLSTDMMVESGDNEPVEISDEPSPPSATHAMTFDEVVLLCDLFYLPFCHGSRGLRLLHDFHWLINHAKKPDSPEASEWRRRRSRFAWWSGRVRRLYRRLSLCVNRELYTELHPYVWELCGVLHLLGAFVSWLELGKFPTNMAANMQGSYTWFSKGWREAFESGAQEPWVFRGGLTSELRRLLPVDCGDCAARVEPVSEVPLAPRPMPPDANTQICSLCLKTYRDGADASDLFPSDLQSLPADRVVMPFLTFYPEFCMVLEDEYEHDGFLDNEEENGEREIKFNGTKPEIVGYVCSALDSREFYRKIEMAWLPEMQEKYPKELLEREDLSPAAKECMLAVTSPPAAPPAALPPRSTLLACGVAGSVRDTTAARRAVTALLAANKAAGSSHVHVCINATDAYLTQFYTKLGFTELAREPDGRLYLGRNF